MHSRAIDLLTKRSIFATTVTPLCISTSMHAAVSLLQLSFVLRFGATNAEMLFCFNHQESCAYSKSKQCSSLWLFQINKPTLPWSYRWLGKHSTWPSIRARGVALREHVLLFVCSIGYSLVPFRRYRSFMFDSCLFISIICEKIDKIFIHDSLKNKIEYKSK